MGNHGSKSEYTNRGGDIAQAIFHMKIALGLLETEGAGVDAATQSLDPPASAARSAIGTVPNVECDPRIIIVVQDGQKHGPMSVDEMLATQWLPANLLFDTVQNRLLIHRSALQKPTSVDLTREAAGQTCGLSPGSRVLEILRILMEHPGQHFTERILDRYTDRLLERPTFVKYIERLRSLLGDHSSNSPFIRTDRGVDTSVSPTGSAYFLDSTYHYRVIRYLPILSSICTPQRPST